MLRALGAIFYLLAALSALIAILSIVDGGPALAIGLASAVSSAFFGAMCLAADEALVLLRRMAPPSVKIAKADDAPSAVPARDPQLDRRVWITK